ncbi:transcriptional regulator [Acidobacteria bacterium Mor1]|nr:transcriptional regulator [Acidobacteria bacterium Mor1]
MSGHNKWSTIKHKKGAADAKRGKLFSRLVKEITIAARLGGGDPDGNPRLRSALATAKGASMPKDNITRAIQKGTGELPGASYEEVNYEGYGPGGIAIFVECMTDNRMRTTPEIRHLLSKHGGNLGELGSVAWMFDRKGMFLVPASSIDEDKLMEVALEAGAEDLESDGDHFQVTSPPEVFHAVRDALEQAGVEVGEASVMMIPQNPMKVDGKKAEQCIKLLDLLEDHDDVQNVYSNLEVDEDVEAGAS